MRTLPLLVFIVSIFVLNSLNSFGAEPVTPQKKIDLMADPAFKDFTFHLSEKRSLTQKREEVWNLEDGVLHVTGKGWGYLRTNQVYRDYHLVLEYQWGERTFGHRGDKARDGGIMVHGYGPDGAFGDMFLSSFQAQLLEGGSGDLIALASRNKDGVPAPTKMTATVKMDRNGKPAWDPKGKKMQLPEPGKNQIAGHLRWRDRDPDWKDIKGFRGANDIENPPGEWNRLEVICQGDTIQVLINGKLVSEASDVSPAQGYVCLQSEAAEYRVRRWELWPLGKFKENWTEAKRSTNTGYRTDGESILPRRFPWNPEKSRAAWKLADGYEIQLVASEPVVCDPVDVVWDQNGEMYVAEMRDYPLPAEGGDYLSRIRKLTDKNGDGVMDEATTWADHLDHVQGLLPLNGGLVATTRTAILFLKDTNGDGKADLKKKLFEQNEPRHNQLQVSSPRWGLDNAIYFNNGLDLKEIYPGEFPDKKIDAKNRNLRYDPYHISLSTVSGRGQFGGSLDNWNRRFFSTNRNPIIFGLFPESAAGRNPFAAITQLQDDLDPPGAKLRPVRLSHTTSVAHAGTYTAACGIGIYRGHLMPEMVGDAFVCDPTSQLVTRNKLRKNGASFTAERVHGKYEFLASEDEWTRPVNLRNGPDGALYICDMYRRFIDHARFFPEEFSKSNYMRAGFDHGRIWRIVPKGKTVAKPKPLPKSSRELVEQLKSRNAWQRIHAQRLLMEKGDISGVEKLLNDPKTSPESLVHAIWLMQAHGKLSNDHIRSLLKHQHEGVLENVISLLDPAEFYEELIQIATGGQERAEYLAILRLGELEHMPVHTYTHILYNTPRRADPWIRRAILSGSKGVTGEILAEMIKRETSGEKIVTGTWDQKSFADTVREFATVAAAEGDPITLGKILRAARKGETGAWRFALAEGLNSGLRRSPLKQKSLSSLIASPPAELKSEVGFLKQVVDQATETVLNRDLSPTVRIAALPLAAQKGQKETFALVEKMIDPSEPAAIQKAACQAMSRFKRTEVADFFFARWNDLAPTPRREALNLIATSSQSAIKLMEKMKAGEIPKSIMPPMQRWSYGRSSNQELKKLATELFGQADNDRAKVIQTYVDGIAGLKGDPEKGKAVFQKATCMTCHKMDGIGVDVGPTLADVRIKPDAALLTDILDPNRAMEERWSSYQIKTKSGATYAGLVASETSDAIELRMPGGSSETIPRQQIAGTTTSGLSLMPVGLEAAISKQDMADLLAFLRK